MNAQGRAPISFAEVTPRELEVFWLAADRLSNQEIARRLCISVRTVESHVAALLRKLGAENRAGLIQTAAGMRERRTPGAGLPRVLSSFVGRTTETAEIGRLIGRRMITLTGPAGAGKTRLALHVAQTATGTPPAVLVDLAPVPPEGGELSGTEAEAGAGVLRAFADALGLGLIGDGAQVRTALHDALADRHTWLIVDNCEHVSGVVARLLGDLLGSVARLDVLATSREPLRLAGETVYEVQPLPAPPRTDDPAAVLSTDSGRLFAERADDAQPGFAVTADNAAAVATICRRLDGLPLAIELAAARVRLFSPAELVAHLDDRFELLTGGPRTGPSRHRTLETALRWSYQLLGEEERLVFERCSVFPAATDYDTAAGVLAYPPLTRASFARAFPRLIDRSLISSRRLGERTEYRLLESVRQFAALRLREQDGEQEKARARHAEYHVTRAAALATDLRGLNQPAALSWFERRWPDLRAAMQWSFERGRTDLAWRFIEGIGTAWEVLGARGEAFDWLDRLLAEPLERTEVGARRAASAAILLCYRDVSLAHSYGEFAVEYAREPADLALAALALGAALSYTERQPEALVRLHHAATLFEELGDLWHYACALCFAAKAEPDLEASGAVFERGAELFGRLGDRVKQANCLNLMAAGAIDARTRLDDAPRWLAEAAALSELTGSLHESAHARVYRATWQLVRGDYALAAAHFAEVLPDLRRIGDQRCVTRGLLGLGESAIRLGDHEAGRHHLSEAVRVARGLGDDLRAEEALRLMLLSPAFSTATGLASGLPRPDDPGAD